MADYCPLIKGKCKEHKCKLYIQLQGTHPQTGQPVDKWDCAQALLPVLMIENSQQQRQTGAAVESLRNVVVKHNERFNAILSSAARARNLEHKEG